MAANTDGNTRIEYMQKRSLKFLLHFLEENDMHSYHLHVCECTKSIFQKNT